MLPIENHKNMHFTKQKLVLILSVFSFQKIKHIVWQRLLLKHNSHLCEVLMHVPFQNSILVYALSLCVQIWVSFRQESQIIADLSGGWWISVAYGNVPEPLVKMFCVWVWGILYEWQTSYCYRTQLSIHLLMPTISFTHFSINIRLRKNRKRCL